MWRVIVHVKHQHNHTGVDLEVPAEVPLTHLIHLLSDALSWGDGASDYPAEYTIRETSSGRVLPPESSLTELKLWDGTCLLFEPVPRCETSGDDQVQLAMLISDSGRQYPLVRQIHHLGRSSTADSNDADLIDLKLEPRGKTVSRHHADLCYEQNRWTLHCIPNTQNPTLCNHKLLEPMQRYPLRDGDSVQLGDVRLKFRELTTQV